MKALMRAVTTVALGAALVAGCGGGGDDNGVGPEIPADVMVVHASPDAPPIDVLIDGRSVLTAFAYPSNTNYEAEPSGNVNFRVNQAGTANILVQSDVPLAQRKFHSVFVTGMAASASLLVIQDDLSHPAANQAKIRFVHLSPDAGTMDMGFEGQGALFSGHAFRGYSPFAIVPAGPQNVQVRAAGTTNVVANVGLTLVDQGIYTIMLRGLVAGSGGQGLTASIIPNK